MLRLQSDLLFPSESWKRVLGTHLVLPLMKHNLATITIIIAIVTANIHYNLTWASLYLSNTYNSTR